MIAESVNIDRVLQRLATLADIGATKDGGVTRIAFSDEERAASELVAHWLREAGLTVSFDPFGNMFGSSDGNAPRAVISMAGSHIDTVPNGGRFDGALGVVAAIESILAMRDAKCLPVCPLEVVVWRCEEPVRFSQGKVGSLVFSRQITPADLHPIEDPPLDLDVELAKDGERLQRDATRKVSSCLELHIEQGSRLERAGRRVGVVTAIAAPVRLKIHIAGRADHSGATPMGDRHDALCAAAELILAIENIAIGEAAHQSVATAADVNCSPGTMNVIPGDATILVDVRGIDPTSMERLVTAIDHHAGDIATKRHIEVMIEVLSRGTPTSLSPEVVTQVSDVARALGYDPFLLPSGAGHDAQCLADMARVGMVFVPSAQGISHSPNEFTHPDDMIAGVRTFAASWWQIANTYARGTGSGRRSDSGSACS